MRDLNPGLWVLTGNFYWTGPFLLHLFLSITCVWERERGTPCQTPFPACSALALREESDESLCLCRCCIRRRWSVQSFLALLRASNPPRTHLLSPDFLHVLQFLPAPLRLPPVVLSSRRDFCSIFLLQATFWPNKIIFLNGNRTSVLKTVFFWIK